MDEIDRAQRHSERLLAAQLANQVGKSQGQGESRTHCLECGDEIPAGRRQAVQGTPHCASCAAWFQQRNNKRQRG